MNPKTSNHNILWVLLMLLPVLSIAQQNSKQLTLSEAIQMTLQHNQLLQMDKAKIDAAIARVQQAEEKKLPELSASTSFLLLNQPGLDLKIATGNGQPPPSTKASLNVNTALIGMLNASVPIYAGGQIRYGIASAEYLVEAARLDATVNQQAVIQNSIAAYINLYKAAQTVKLIEENLKDEQQRVKDFTNLEKNGLLARNDLMRASLQASNVELALLEAQNNLKDASVNMCLMLGLPEQTELLVEAAAFEQTPTPGILSSWEDSAMLHRNELAAYGQRQQSIKAGMQAVKGSQLPSVAATGGYFSAHLQNIATISHALNVGVGVKYNISSLWKTKARLNELQANQQELQAATSLMQDKIRLEVNKSYEAVLLMQKKTEVFDKAIEQATENYRITNNKYNNGLATLTDLLDADLSLLRARLNKVNAKADATLAYANLLKAAGSLQPGFGK